MDILQDIWDNYKKIIIGVGTGIVIFIVGISLFSTLYNPLILKFEGDDSSIIATSVNKLKLQASATNKKQEKFDISWNVSDGTLSQEKGEETVWNLPNKPGSYTITIKAGNKVKSKTVTILKNELGELSLKDNKDIKYIDSDEDGLSDTYEKEISKTDENVSVESGSTLNDGNTLELNGKNGKFIVKNDSIGAEVQLEGKDNLASTTIDLYDIGAINENYAIATKLYRYDTSASVTSANISIKYDKKIISQKGLDEGKLSIYKFDIENNKFIKQESTVNTSALTVSANVQQLGLFFIADSSKIKELPSTELMFVIDNSGSMYSKDIISESAENDPDFKRVDLSNKLIDNLKGECKFAAGKFTFEYKDLISMTSDKEKVKEKINSIKKDTEKFSGTYIGNAFEESLKQFNSEGKDIRKYMILLTDGKDTTDIEGYDEKKLDNAIAIAKTKNVKVFTIGLGKDIDSEVLKKVSTQTGGSYYYANNAESLDDIFQTISSNMNYSLTKFDELQDNEYFVLNNNYFLNNENGMPIENFSTTKNNYGATYGMSLFSKLYFENKFPSSMGSISVKNTDTDTIEKVNGYTLNMQQDNNEQISNSLSEYKLDDLNFIQNTPKDFMASSVNNGILPISDKYKSTLNSYGCKYFYITLDDNKSEFKKYESYIVDNTTNNADNSDSESKEESKLSQGDLEFVNAIYRLDILKYRDERISFEKDPDKAFEYLANSLNKKEAPILIINDSYGVLAKKILVNSKDSNDIKLEVYDSNYGTQKQYINLKRSKILNDIKDNNTNNYEYKCTYNGKNVSLSISIPNIETNL